MNRDLVLMTITLFSWGVGEGMFFIFQPVYLEQLGATPVLVGFILGAQGVAMALMQAPAGYLTDRLGARPLMWASWILGTIAAWWMALAASLPAFVIGFTLYSLTSAVLAPMNTYVTAVRGRLTAERALTLVSASFHLGSVVGPLLGGLVAETLGLNTIYRIAGVLFVLSTVVVLFARRPPVPELHHDTKTNSTLKNRPFLVLLALVFVTMFALYFAQPLTPIYMQSERGLSLQEIGVLGTFGSLGAVIISLTLGHLKPRTGYLVGQPFSALFSLLILRGTSLPVYSLAYFSIGGFRLTRSMSLAYARTIIRSHETGLAYGLLETANAVAVILAPPIAGLLYQHNPVDMYRGAVLLIGFVFLLNLILLNHPPNSMPDRSLS